MGLGSARCWSSPGQSRATGTGTSSLGVHALKLVLKILPLFPLQGDDGEVGPRGLPGEPVGALMGRNLGLGHVVTMLWQGHPGAGLDGVQKRQGLP